MPLFTDWLILIGILVVSLFGWRISSNGVWNKDRGTGHPRWWQLCLGAVLFVVFGFGFLALLGLFIAHLVTP